MRVAALCVDAGRVLLARHVRGEHATYLLPGGGLEVYETARVALERELREEVGVACKVGELRYVIEVLAPDTRRHLVQLVFAAALTGPPASSSDPRVAECSWHPIASLRTLPFYPDAGGQIADDLEHNVGGCRYLLAAWRD